MELSPVVRILFTSNGQGLLGLCQSGVHKYWRATEGVLRPWRPASGVQMVNEVRVVAGETISSSRAVRSLAWSDDSL